MKRAWLSLFHLIVLVLLAACSSTTIVDQQAQPTQQLQQAPDVTPTALVVEKPAQGKATMAGRLLSAQTKKPIGQMAVRLAEVYRQGEEGAYVLDGASSPGAFTNDQGEFVIPNVDPKEYVIVAGDPYASNDVVKETSGKPKPWTMVTDQVLNVGDVQVTLQP
jgi:hypothetical protein